MVGVKTRGGTQPTLYMVPQPVTKVEGHSQLQLVF